MEIGTGIAVAGSIAAITIPAATIIMSAIKMKTPEREHLSPCLLHPTIEGTLKRIEDALSKRSEDLWEAITTIQGDIKVLLRDGK